jgi:hypothetical protein
MGVVPLPALIGLSGVLLAVAIYFLWVRKIPKKD